MKLTQYTRGSAANLQLHSYPTVEEEVNPRARGQSVLLYVRDVQRQEELYYRSTQLCFRPVADAVSSQLPQQKVNYF